MQLPKGFIPVTFQHLMKTAISTEETVGLAPQLYQHLGLSELVAQVRIVSLEQKHLIQFAISPDGKPSVFTSNEGSPEEQLLMDALVKFWDVTGDFDPSSGQIHATSAGSMLYVIQTPDGPMSVMAKVVYRLHQMGLITRDDDGQYHAISKAKLMEWVSENGICDFCSDPNPKHTEMVPDFWMEYANQNSVGGWATCDTCHQMIVENKRTDLMRRGIESAAHGKFTAAAIKSLHRQFWDAHDSMIDAAGVGAALIDFIEDTINPDKMFVNPKLKQKEARVEAIRRLTGLTQDEMSALGKGDVLYKDVAKKLSAWRKKFGADNYEATKKIAQMLNEAEQPRLPPGHVPHWQAALDAKFEAASTLNAMAKKAEISPYFTSEAIDLQDSAAVARLAHQAHAYQEAEKLGLFADIGHLQNAEVFSFNAETMHAIIEGAKSIPHESPLSSVDIPNVRSGWFWFAEPFPAAPSPKASDTTAGLLWGWVDHDGEPAIRFSAYVRTDKPDADLKQGNLLPSAKWYWPRSMSFHQMISHSIKQYRGAYGGLSEEDMQRQFNIGEKATISVVADLSIFFMMACVWFKQKVLVETPGHIERHARKRYVREHKLKETPTVRVIALRKSIREEAIRTVPTEESKRKMHVRFVVSGHARLQPCGPGNKDRKLIWIDPYPKGPDDAPFKPSADKVFAVIR